MVASISTEIRIPRETVNDDFVTIAEWSLADGSDVETGQLLAEIETSKAAIEVFAEASGRIEILHAAGGEVAIGEVIGMIHSGGSAPPASLQQPAGDNAEFTPTDAESQGNASVITLFSTVARDLIEKRGIDAAKFDGYGMVREADVFRMLGEEDPGSKEADAASLTRTKKSRKPTALEASEAFAAAKTVYDERPKRGLLGDARASSSHRKTSVFWLAWNYFWRNWILGLLVRISPRGVILPVHRLRGVSIGRDCFVDPTATLETAYPERVSLGDDVRVAAGAVIMTHIKAPDLLRETGAVPPVDKPVGLNSHCFIGVNACVMPGVTVGEGAVVSSGAVVLSDVPPYTVVAGNPAQVVRNLRPKN